VRGDQGRRGTIGSAASHIGDSDISLNRRFCQGKKRGTVLVGRSKDVNVFVKRRKTVFVSVIVVGKLP